MINKKPKISIVVPVYNVENYLERCLESLINQQFKDIEIIAVNDGSKDTSLDILKLYGEKDKRIKVIDKENSGVSDCRNVGLERANGEYIAFVDSDDWISSDMFEVMYQEATSLNSDLVMCSYVREFSAHSKEKIFNLPKVVLYEKKEISSKLHRMLFGPIDDELKNPEGLDALGTVWGKLYRLDIIKQNEVKFVDLSVIGSNEDTLFNIYFFKFIKNALFLNRPFYHYWRANSNSITSRYNPVLKNQWRNLFEHMNKFITENNLDAVYHKALINRMCMCVVGLGLNECSKENKLSTINKINNIKSILNEDFIKNAYSKFDLNHFSIHWKVFYFFNKHRIAFFSYSMLRTIEYLRTRV